MDSLKPITLPRSRRKVEALFRELEFHPKRSLGQNFFTQKDILAGMAREAMLSKEDGVLEIGAGMGHLSEVLVEQAGLVWAVEIDPILGRFLQEWGERFSNLQILLMDVLSSKHTLQAEVVKKLKEGYNGHPLKVVSNLPYSICAPVILNLLTGDFPLGVMIVMVQEEIAARLLASPSTNQYGPLSILSQVNAKIEYLSSLSNKMFYPTTKVMSAIVKLTPDSKVKSTISDYCFFEKVVREVFTKRRKTIFNALRQSRLTAQEDMLINVLKESEIDPARRGETLNLEEWIRLVNNLNGFGLSIN